MDYLSDNIDDNLETTNPNAHHWREMYLRQLKQYDIMEKLKDKRLKEKEEKYQKVLAEKEEKYEKLLCEKEKLIDEKDHKLLLKDEIISLLHSGIDQNLLNSHDESSSLSLTSMKKLIGFDLSHTVRQKN